jgi:hypothetical protein
LRSRPSFSTGAERRTFRSLASVSRIGHEARQGRGSKLTLTTISTISGELLIFQNQSRGEDIQGEFTRFPDGTIRNRNGQTAVNNTRAHCVVQMQATRQGSLAMVILFTAEVEEAAGLIFDVVVVMLGD